MKLLIKNGELINPGGPSGRLDVLIEDGRITQISEHINAEGIKKDEVLETLEVLEAKGKAVLPGFVDMHCHLREPGQEFKETIYTGTRAAAAGGFTTIACMPNTKPVVDNEAVVKFIVDKAASEGAVRVLPIAAITKGQGGKELTEMGFLLEAGAIAFSDDGKPVENPKMMELALRYARNFNALIISHCEDKALAADGVMNEGAMATKLGLPGIPGTAEELMVSREILLAENMGTKVHIAHVSTAGSVELIRQAKKRGVRVTAETCPHYFAATDELVEGYGTATKVNPPLRTEADRLAVIAGLADGTLDAIATDHAPHHADDKDVEYLLAASGIVGLETAFGLAVTFLVNTGKLTLEELVGKMALRPAEILGLTPNGIAVGNRADIAIASLTQEWTVNPSKFYSKGRNTPFADWKLIGKITDTICAGLPVYKNEQIVV
jgi:dihydroorotase